MVVSNGAIFDEKCKETTGSQYYKEGHTMNSLDNWNEENGEFVLKTEYAVATIFPCVFNKRNYACEIRFVNENYPIQGCFSETVAEAQIWYRSIMRNYIAHMIDGASLIDDSNQSIELSPEN